MPKTTTSLPTNISHIMESVVGNSLESVRLHPRRGEVPNLASSKLGGAFLWPENELWPRNDVFNAPYIPVLQINSADIPQMLFPDGKNLMQFLWVPIPSENAESHLLCVPLICWRSIENIKSLNTNLPIFLPDNYMSPNHCKLTFEQITEYPAYEELDIEQINQLESEVSVSEILSIYSSAENSIADANLYAQYRLNLSVCLCNKMGGHVFWIQKPEWPICDCGRNMEHLLTLSDFEIDSGSWIRWLPIEDRPQWKIPSIREEIAMAPGWNLGGGAYYCFVCRSCPEWPIKGVFQR